MAGDDAEEFEGALPMGGVILGHQILEPVEGELFGQGLIEQAGEFGGQARRLIGTPGGVLGGGAGQDQPGENQLALEPGERRGERLALLASLFPFVSPFAMLARAARFWRPSTRVSTSTPACTPS